MTREELLALHTEMCSKAKALMERKNKDYGGGTVFGNLDLIEELSQGRDSTEKGILIRMGDKVSRLYNILCTANEIAVSDESVEDSLQDLINYAVLLAAKRASRKKVA